MYFFYFDESGNRDPEVSGTDTHGKIFAKDYLYVLHAIGLHEARWVAFDQEIAAAKLALRAKLHKQKGIELQSLADCEVKSTSLRIGKTSDKKGYSAFVHNLDAADKAYLTQLYFSQMAKHYMRLFAVVVDKRHLKLGTTAEFMHKKAYEIALERIEHYMKENHPNERGLVVMDSTHTRLDHAVAMQHAFFQREGNMNLQFRHIVEYPFFTDSRLSCGIQLADLCAYNTYRVFRDEDFAYPYFQKMAPFFYRSKKSPSGKIDGLKVWPDNSPLIALASEKCRALHEAQKTKSPAIDASITGQIDVRLGLPKHSSISSLRGGTQRQES